MQQPTKPFAAAQAAQKMSLEGWRYLMQFAAAQAAQKMTKMPGRAP